MAQPWLQPPRFRTVEDEDHRRATWTELFYDLVFVVTIRAIATSFGAEATPIGLLMAAALLVPVWWAWVDHTVYGDRFDTDDVIQRLLTALQMLAIASMAITADGAFGDQAGQFALGYVVVRLVLIVFNLRVAWYVPEARPLVGRYAVVYAIEAAFWLISVVAPPPYRYLLWAAGTAISLGAPLLTRRVQRELPVSTSHVAERFGLFTIIVIGETILSTVTAIDNPEWGMAAVLTAVIGFGIIFALWWVYFDTEGSEALERTSSESARKASRWTIIWVYGHFPLICGLLGLGISIEHLVNLPPGEAAKAVDRWLLGGSVALTLASMALVEYTTRPPGGDRQTTIKTASRAIGAAVAVVAVAAPLPPVFLAAAMLIIAATIVGIDIANGTTPQLADEIDESEDDVGMVTSAG